MTFSVVAPDAVTSRSKRPTVNIARRMRNADSSTVALLTVPLAMRAHRWSHTAGYRSKPFIELPAGISWSRPWLILVL